MEGAPPWVCSHADAALLVVSVDLVDGIDKAGISEVHVIVYSKLPVALNSAGHSLIKGRVDDVGFGCSMDGSLILFSSISHKSQKLLLTSLIELLGHLTWRYMVNVLKPLEVRAGDTTSVHEEIWGDHDVLC